MEKAEEEAVDCRGGDHISLFLTAPKVQLIDIKLGLGLGLWNIFQNVELVL